MKNKIILGILFPVLLLSGCQTEDISPETNSEIIPEDILLQIQDLGYDTSEIYTIESERHGTGYVVNQDIILFDRDLNLDSSQGTTLRIAEVEQYRTTLVPELSLQTITRSGTPGTPRQDRISLVVRNEFPQVYVDAARAAATRYNNLGLSFRINVLTEDQVRTRAGQRATGDITIRPGSAFASAGFPFEETRTIRTRTGTRTETVVTHFDEILMNVGAINSNNRNHLATIIAHEIGHCIGFRHTDFFNRSLSCGFGGNEGQGDDGAINIPGTPTGTDSSSFMQACIAPNENRPFTQNDIVALRFLHTLQ